MGVVLMVTRWSPKPKFRVQISTPMPITEYSTAWFSALVLGTRGRRFESYYSDQFEADRIMKEMNKDVRYKR